MQKNNKVEAEISEPQMALPFMEIVTDSQDIEEQPTSVRVYTADRLKEMGYTKLRGNKVQAPTGEMFHMRKSKRPLQAIRNFCAECFGMDRRNRKDPMPIDDIRNCSDPMCPLFDFRFGKNSFLKRSLTDEQLEAARERMELVRKSISNQGFQYENRRSRSNPYLDKGCAENVEN